jgi:hypothetical protein
MASMDAIAWNVQRQGRRWHGQESRERFQLTPEKIEMIEGQLFWSEEDRRRMLALLLENVGADVAVRIGSPEVWRAAIAELK